MIVWQGPSLIDAQEVVAILTGLGTPSQNSKTGTMAQLWILPATISPVKANRTGLDYSVCGDCPLRGHHGEQRRCYVNLGRAPLAIWNKWWADGYEYWDGSPIKRHRSVRSVRLGAWGDPAAIPIITLKLLTAEFGDWTGYTHQWKNLPRHWGSLLMASTETAEETTVAQAKGWRTFSTEESPDDILCPATNGETQCIDCRMCKGTASNAKSIYIPPHGSGKRHFNTETQTA